MTYMDKVSAAHLIDAETAARTPMVIVIEDSPRLSDVLCLICECLDVTVVALASSDDFATTLRESRPMAVVAEADMTGQDGCHVLKTVAAYDRNLPVMLLTGTDPAIQGAVDAVEELWDLSSVSKWPDVPGIGPTLDFLFRAGRNSDCVHFMPV